MTTTPSAPNTRYERFAWHYDRLTARLYRPGEEVFYARLARESDSPLPAVGEGPGVRAKVLEPACGAARVLSLAHAAGCEVWGTDRSQPMLDLAAKRLARNDSPAAYHLLRQDLDELDLPETFALAMLPLEAFRLLPDPAAQRAFLTRLRGLMRPGGRMALDLTMPEAVFPQHLSTDVIQAPEGGTVTSTTRWVRRDGLTIEATAFRIGGDEVVCEDVFRDVTAGELLRQFAATGWTAVVWDADFKGTPYQPGEARLVAVAEVSKR